MKCSTMSDNGHPTLSPLTIGVRIPLIFEIVTRSALKSVYVVGTVRLCAAKNDFRYQNPGLTFPV